MKKHAFFLKCILGLAVIFTHQGLMAQPANNSCGTAQAIVPNGGCINGTTTGADDSWIGSVGCQTGGNHADVWYTFTATNTQLNFTLNSLGIGNNVEVIVAYSPCGSCVCSFQIHGDACGPAPLTDSVTGLVVGGTYYVTISSSGADGNFQFCPNLVQAVNVPGQDCPTASNVCDDSPFGQSTVANGTGAIFGGGSQEPINAMTCFGSDERQSQWYTFTASNTGTIEFNINPLVSSDDYDFALFDITTSGCNLASGGATVVACNWSGCKGSTGITSDVNNEPGVVSAGAGCFGGPAAWNQSPPTITACHEYALLIDNFTTSNNGFNFIWGGASGGMTATIGPDAIVGFTASTISSSPCTIGISGVTNRACYTYTYTWGDGTSSVGALPPNHVYASSGIYTITQTITDANGCQATTSQTVNCALLANSDILLSGKTEPGQVALSWQLPEQMNPESFIIQHSADGEAFRDIQTLPALSAKTEAGYSTLHQDPALGQNFYRVIVKEKDGHYEPSEVLKVMYDEENANLTLWPNPAGEQMEVSFQTDRAGDVLVELLDIQGRVVRTIRSEIAQGQKTFSIDLSGLAPGAYFVKASTDYSVYTRSFLKK